MANEQDLTPLLDTQQNQLAMIISDGDSLDNKAMALAAINITLLIFIAQDGLRLQHWWQLAGLVVPYGVSIVLNIFAILPKPYIGASVDLTRHAEYLTMGKDELMLQLLADTQLAITQNQATNRTYQRYWLVSLALTIIGTLTLFAILLV
jgi:hypothetical protein